MQGLAKYNDSPSPKRRSHPPLPPPASLQSTSTAGPSRRVDRSDVRGTSPPPKRARISPPPSAPRSTAQAQSVGSRNGSKGKSRQDAIEIDDDEENVGTDPMRGLSEDEIFARVSRPEDIPGLENWGIPPAVDPDLCSPQLKAKIAQFLNLKRTQNQHINTSLLQSTSFHNPHIYSKLVEFVDLSERKSHFTQGGWLTRLDVESVIQDYGPKKMGEEQRRREEESKRAKEVSGRSKIDFQGSRRRDGDEGSKNRDRDRDKGRDRGGDRERGGHDERDRGNRDRERDRERDRGGSRAEGKYRDTLGLSTRDREGGWDERDMTKRKPKYRYY